MPAPFTHLHFHSHYSLLDGAIKVKGLGKYLSELGYDSCAITDHGNLHGVIEFEKDMKKAGIKPIIGMEAYVAKTRHLMQPLDINKAIRRTLFLLENQTLFQNIDIKKYLDESIPLVQGDSQQLNHMFMNIILNAAQAMSGKGELVFKTRVSADSRWVQIEISDTGPGIPEDILSHIFEPFFTTKEEGEGTGLGLSLVYGIVENHGGRIKCESWAGKGTTFIIELPLKTNGNGGANLE